MLQASRPCDTLAAQPHAATLLPAPIVLTCLRRRDPQAPQTSSPLNGYLLVNLLLPVVASFAADRRSISFLAISNISGLMIAGCEFSV